MNNLQLFNNSEFGQLRTITEQNQVWFCGTDIATILGYKNSQKALNDHCRTNGVTFRSVIDSMGRTQKAKFITEGNVYRLIARSKLPAAEKFERWVFDEILPTIRKTGSYSTNPAPEYQFQPKTYKGQPCVTLADLAHLSGITPHSIRYHMKRVLNRGSDYVVLQGNELINFKAENTALDLRLASELTIVFKSGFVKLARIIICAYSIQ